MGARFPGGKWADVAATFVVVDTESQSVEAFAVGEGRVVVPYEFRVVEGWPGS
jgi:hypothetical protein